MLKIKLDIEDLQVESFSTAGVTSEFGTVRGHGANGFDDGIGGGTLPPENTCYQTHCGGYTCEWTKCAADGCVATAEQQEAYNFGTL